MSDAQTNNLMGEAEAIVEQLRVLHIQRGVIPPTAAKQPEPAKFFDLEGQYLIAPGTTTAALMNDSSNLMACAIAVLDQSYQDLNECQHAALYLMQQAKALHDEAISNMLEQGLEV